MTRTLALLAAVGCLSGCVDNRNQRLYIGQDGSLASIPPEVAEPTLDQDGNPADPELPTSDETTLTGLSRDHFEPTVYRVPIDGTAHELHGIDRLAWPSETARQRGEFPTATSALETGGNPSTRDQVLEAAAQPFIAAGGVLFHTVALVYPEFLAAHFISGTRSSPSGLYERAPAPSPTDRLGVIHGTETEPESADEPPAIEESAAG